MNPSFQRESFARVPSVSAALAVAVMGATLAHADKPPSAGSATCFSSTPYPVGVEPSCVIMADLNGDAFNDLAVANHGSTLDNRISILINNGDGTFAPSVYYNAGIRPYWIDSGDIDSDGDIDLAVTNFFDTIVSVFRNNGDGTFAPQEPYTVGSNPGFVILDKLDGDNDLDLAVTNIGDATVSLLMNNGDGTFAAQVAYPAGLGPYGLVAADFNGDLALDLATSNHHDTTVSLLMNNGDGTLAAPVPYTVDSGPVGNDAADLNGDGLIDLVVANGAQGATGTTISVLLNSGGGVLSPHVTYPVPAGPYTIKVADFNADGVGDVAVCSEANAVSVFLNNGDGTLAPPSSATIGLLPVGLEAGDLDGNGTPEIAITCYGGNEIWVLFNQYAGIVQQPLDQSVAAGGSAVFSVIAGGPAPFTYQWRRDGVDLTDGGNVAGALTDTLTIAPADEDDIALYDVVVTNDCGSVVSDPAALQIIVNTCPADINNDGNVNVADLLGVIGAWGACVTPPCAADVTGDNLINVADLLAVIGAWGPCP